MANIENRSDTCFFINLRYGKYGLSKVRFFRGKIKPVVKNLLQVW